ncbi:MAG TPA: carboxypeptidase-like regulatory domain-containing protein [Candidatus Polarisedimenticolia bacterium]|jgi:hypothetical protein|nr:carboxypeptidase-like regulatory domain-containing protein [Candidatus Polarisedimenticolia bacterium]
MGFQAAVKAFRIAAVLCAACLLAGRAEAVEAPAEVVIRGEVKDQAGAPLAGYPVRLIKTKTTLSLLHFSTGSKQIEEARAQTDASGRFELRVLPDRKSDYFYLRFYDPKTFDPVRYAVPGDVDITRPIKTKTELVVDKVVPDHPDWRQVEELLHEFGAQSNRGRILRSLGLPERRETFSDLPGRENWWYYAKGICYQFLSDELLKVRRYDPVLPPGRAS